MARHGANTKVQFRLKTVIIASANVAGLASLLRLDWVFVATGAILLFAILLFSEVIWPWLRD